MYKRHNKGYIQQRSSFRQYYNTMVQKIPANCEHSQQLIYFDFWKIINNSERYLVDQIVFEFGLVNSQETFQQDFSNSRTPIYWIIFITTPRLIQPVQNFWCHLNGNWNGGVLDLKNKILLLTFQKSTTGGIYYLSLDFC